jgi:hypothetical protein
VFAAPAEKTFQQDEPIFDCFALPTIETYRRNQLMIQAEVQYFFRHLIMPCILGITIGATIATIISLILY